MSEKPTEASVKAFSRFNRLISKDLCRIRRFPQPLSDLGKCCFFENQAADGIHTIAQKLKCARPTPTRAKWKSSHSGCHRHRSLRMRTDDEIRELCIRASLAHGEAFTAAITELKIALRDCIESISHLGISSLPQLSKPAPLRSKKDGTNG